MTRSVATVLAALALHTSRPAVADLLSVPDGTAPKDPFDSSPPKAPTFAPLLPEAQGGTASMTISSCEGFQRHWLPCDLGDCDGCVPQDCQWSEWVEWKDLGACTGLGERSRKVSTEQNECGKPCAGVSVETASRPEYIVGDPDCDPNVDVDCAWGSWSDWSRCGKDPHMPNTLAQSVRHRQVNIEAAGQGLPCEGISRETRSCGSDQPVDCALTEWGVWTECSTTCGTGWRAQIRRTRQEAEFGGTPCAGVLRRTAPCSIGACDATCRAGSWSNWEGCRGDAAPSHKHQMFRRREIIQSSPDCDLSLQEIQGCPVAEEEQNWCEPSHWSEWSSCSRSCGGGQHTRSRKIADGSDCRVRQHAPLEETAGCKEQLCPDAAIMCKVSAWTSWSKCSQDCGTGVTTRTRILEGVAQKGGCEATLEDAKMCRRQKCKGVACVWEQWSDWGGCSASCGGGVQRRSRAVRQPARDGGAECMPNDAEELVPCNTKTCQTCVDGRWSDWSAWTSCTATCAPAYRKRDRRIAQLHNGCGLPATGPEEEYGLCTELPNCQADVDQDCIISSWSEWSDCSSSCSGVRERVRKIDQYRQGNGLPCLHNSLMEVAPCNTFLNGVVPKGCEASTKDCVLSHWDDWSQCSKTCSGGERTRLRLVVSPSSPGGIPCEDSLSEMEPCNEQDCSGHHVIDCLWGEWEDWSACLQECGGERFRERRIEKSPSKWGRRCDPGAGRMVESCLSSCESQTVFCMWSVWSDVGACSSTCGSASKVRQRHLTELSTRPPADALFLEGPASNFDCAGIQTAQAICEENAPCSKGDCVPADCVLTTWSMWSESSCLQLCERTRNIHSESECGGQMCNGTLLETKRCPKDCSEALPCILGTWSNWLGCEDGDAGQRARTRGVVQEPQNGGTPCSGPLAETRPCPVDSSANQNMDCILEDWDSWNTCSKKCAGGLQQRTRKIAHEAEGSGRACAANLMEVSGCNLLPCREHPQDCDMGAWSSWSSCTADSVEGRKRRVDQFPDEGGEPCTGSLHQVRPCFSAAVDCKLSAWTPWDQCDKSCGGGQTQRQRQIFQNPRHGGKPCPVQLVQVAGCQEMPCPTDTSCKVSPWAEWGICTATCGLGYKSRMRFIEDRAQRLEEGCRGKLLEAIACQTPACSCEECQWGAWEKWGACSRSCGGGQRERSRDIARWPRPGCPGCEAKTKVYAEPCNEQACPTECAEATWDDWNNWEACSTTCEGGIQWRSRSENTSASCGKAPYGAATEVKECMKGVPCEVSRDCQLSDWAAWSGCSATCSGTKTRSRDVRLPASGSGRPCEGATMESTTCMYDVKSPLLDWTVAPLYMALMSTQENNLGGKGPLLNSSHKFLRFPGVASFGSQTLDLVVANTSVYTPGDSSANGIQGSFGNVNVKSGTSVGVSFEFVDGKTGTPYMVDDLHLKFFDLDSCSHSAINITAISPCGEYYTSPGSFFHASGECDRKRQVKFQKVADADPSCPLGSGAPQRFRLEDTVLRNLGGWGPDVGDRVLRFESVLENVDLIVTTDDTYSPSDASRNGHFGKLGVIDVASKSQAKLRFEFVKTGTNDPAVVKSFNISFFDIDQPNALTREVITVSSGGRCYLRSAMSTLLMRPAEAGATQIESSATEAETPMDPDALDQAQEAYVADCHFYQTSTFDVTLQVRRDDNFTELKGSAGRVFLFSGQACEVGGEMIQAAAVAPSDCHPTTPQVVGAGPGLAVAAHENNAVSLRFRGVSKVQLQLAASGGGCCSHNFLFAGKVCAGGRCDPCGGDRMNCSFMPWSPWSECDVTCGGGHSERSRNMTRTPFGIQEGCAGIMKEVKSCNMNNCAMGCAAVNCQWGDWADWSACGASCGGLRSRNRHIKVSNSCGGSACIPADCQMYESCPNVCEEHYCVWDEWSKAGECSTSCGPGRQLRERKLRTATQRPPDLVMKAAEHKDSVEGVQAVERRRVHSLAFAAACGACAGCCGLAALLVLRRRSRRKRRSWVMLPQPNTEELWHEDEVNLTSPLAA